MKKTQLSKSDIKQLNLEIESSLGLKDYLSKKDSIEKLQSDEHEILIKGQEKQFFFYNDKPVPTINLVQKETLIPHITVDMGAVAFVVKGVDIMRPGIVDWDKTLDEGDLVRIIDEKNQKTLGIGQMLVTAKELDQTKTGKVVKNLHYVGDKIWNLTP